MYLHVGEEVLVRTKDIIAILDIESASSSPFMEEFITRQDQQIVHLAKGTVKSIVVTGNHIYYSPLASGTLKKRSQKLSVPEF
ncbi:extracellular matrix regulator RemB [Mesobacillus jeotgali]|uniref:extracellular matrix regulator RemB n=1 Tax=Mesobacillus jeotgali TaxID=129985 RepID=UPI000C836CBA|nr:extracellular matrix/biofilm biosynthesis regulator RemA family protein [Mesobacillus jeotgali]